jgi:Tfp pilus assembly protein PilP
MTWRRPDLWPRMGQRAAMALAGLIGLGLMSPGWLGAWQDWEQAQTTLADIAAQREHTQTLHQQMLQMQANAEPMRATFMGAADMNHLAHQHGLTATVVTMDRAVPVSVGDALQIQQWPIHLHVTGSWKAWLAWLAQWPKAMPSVTLAGLDLKAQAQGGVSVQMVLLSPRLLPPVLPANPSGQEGVHETPIVSDPFDAQIWRNAQQQHAQLHPSYARHVLPEMQRTRDVLEHFPRQQLRYVGHLSTGGALQALVQATPSPGPGGVSSVHRVQAGDRLGQDFGHVLRVETHQIQLRELAVDPNGIWQTRQITMPFEVSP